jgi:putative transposase
MKSFRIEIKPNKTQAKLIQQSCDVARFAYNWMLGIKTSERAALESLAKMYDLDKVPSIHGTAIDWHKEWCKFKIGKDWITDVSKCCGQFALKDLEISYKMFFANLTKHPKFKKKGQKDSFRVDGWLLVDYNTVQIPNIGKIKLKEYGYATDKRIQLSSATISRDVDRWFVSFFIKNNQVIPTLPDLSTCQESEIVGVDLGIKELAVTSDGQTFENPKAYQKYLKRLKRYQRQVSRKQKGSNSRKNSALKLSRLHRKIRNIRKDNINKLTTSVAKTKPKLIVIETLKPKNMMKNHNLAGSIADAAFGEIKRQFEYKSEWSGIHLVKAPQFYASSKFCSCCGAKKNDLKLSDREWKCSSCGAEHDRDFNASQNLKFFGCWLLNIESTASYAGIDASGDERLQFLREQCSSMKLEFELKNPTLRKIK